MTDTPDGESYPLITDEDLALARLLFLEKLIERLAPRPKGHLAAANDRRLHLTAPKEHSPTPAAMFLASARTAAIRSPTTR